MNISQPYITWTFPEAATRSADVLAFVAPLECFVLFSRINRALRLPQSKVNILKSNSEEGTVA